MQSPLSDCITLSMSPAWRHAPLPETHTIKIELAIGATRESGAAADAIRDEISIMARDGSLERVVSVWSPVASRELASLTRLQEANSHLRRYKIGLASV